MRALFIIVFALVFVVLAVPVMAQGERVTEAAYNTALAKALDAASSRDRRVITEEKFYSGTQMTGERKIVSEFAGPDARKIEVSEEFNGKQAKSDSVKIGNDFFCRDGNKKWKHSKADCAKADMMAIPDGDYEYFVQDDADFGGRKIYTRRASFTDAGSKRRDAVRMKSIEIKFTADDYGIADYTETRRGGIEPGDWSSVQVTRYEYPAQGLRESDPRIAN